MAATQASVVRSQTPLKKARRVVGFLLRAVLYVALCVIFLVPFVWMIFGSVRAEHEIFQYLAPFGIRTFIPIDWTLDSYLTILGLNEVGRTTGYAFGHETMVVDAVGLGRFETSRDHDGLFGGGGLPEGDAGGVERPDHAHHALEAELANAVADIVP